MLMLMKPKNMVMSLVLILVFALSPSIAKPNRRANRSSVQRANAKKNVNQTESPTPDSEVRVAKPAAGVKKVRAAGTVESVKRKFDRVRSGLSKSGASKAHSGERKLAKASAGTAKSAVRVSINLTKSRVTSLFTRSARERSQHIRPANEKSQHIIQAGTAVAAESRPAASHRRRAIFDRPKVREFRSRTNRGDRDVVRRRHRYEHIYRDVHNRLCHRIVRPRYSFAVYYNWGPWFTFQYVHPYYHRKYIFVSLGCCWPAEYRYVRYYWYGCHPYYWYGCCPVAQQVDGDTYNYYTYNYNYGGGETAAADIVEKPGDESGEQPEGVTRTDTYFEEAVKAFEAGDYDTAVEKLAEASEFAPEDLALGFAYSQALLADEQYSQAARVLRESLMKLSPENEGVFYPRGLYAGDDILFAQIDNLAEQAEHYAFDADLQLLLGYQLLGVGEIDAAAEPLQKAELDRTNKEAAQILLRVLEKIRTDAP